MKFKQYEVRIDGLKSKASAFLEHAQDLGYSGGGICYTDQVALCKFDGHLNSLRHSLSKVRQYHFQSLSLEEFLELSPEDVREKDDDPKMIVGDTEAETLRLNGWGVGDILEGDDNNGPDRIAITAIGTEHFLCKWDHECKGEFKGESRSTTLTCRNWKKVGNIYQGKED